MIRNKGGGGFYPHPLGHIFTNIVKFVNPQELQVSSMGILWYIDIERNEGLRSTGVEKEMTK